VAIDIRREELLTLGQASRSLPGKPALSTCWRWHRKGVRGIRLETIVIGGKRFTSAQAIERFALALTTASEATSTVAGGVARPERAPSTTGRTKEAGLV
jgi:hypothetical protein